MKRYSQWERNQCCLNVRLLKQLYVVQLHHCVALTHCLIMLYISPLNAELNPIYHLLALLGGATIVVVSRLRVNVQQLQKFYFVHFRNLRLSYYSKKVKQSRNRPGVANRVPGS